MRSYGGVQERKLMVSRSSQFQNRNPGTKAIRNNNMSEIKFLAISDRCISDTLFWSEQMLNTSFADRSQMFVNYHGLLYLDKHMEGNCWNKE